VVSKTVHIITFTFLRFQRFLKIQKYVTLRFFALLHTFSRTMPQTPQMYINVNVQHSHKVLTKTTENFSATEYFLAHPCI